MKILHVGISSAYTEGMSYQDNLLTEQNVKDGHTVIIVSDCNSFVGGKMVYTPPEDKLLENGVHLIRMEYKKIINRFISSKIRCVPELYQLINEFAPDVILYHGVVGWELLTVGRYKKEHPDTKLYIDSHEDYNNSGTNSLSRIIQYRIFNRYLVKQILPYVDKILSVSQECSTFIKDLLLIPDEMIEFYPLGGSVINEEDQNTKRKKIRKELNLSEDDILLVHSGKMDELKRTDQIIYAMSKIKDDRIKLILIGSISETIEVKMKSLIDADKRIMYLGWKSSEELLDYLCACDLYLQPGSQSSTLQNALCCGCAIATFPHESYKHMLGDDIFYITNIDDLVQLFNDILKDRRSLISKKQQAYSYACKVLDYKVLGNRLYH